MADLLTDDRIEAGLAALPGWEREDDAIVRHYRCDSFLDAIAFIDRIAPLAEEANHHPELTNVYSRLTVRLTTHDAGGITQKDLDLATRIEAVAPGA